MKKLITKILYWALEKLDEEGIKKARIGLVITVDYRKLVPQDGKWHNIGYSVDAWIMREKNKKVLKFDSVTVFRDGKEKRKKW